MKDPWFEAFYPDLARAGGLLAVLRARLPALEFRDPYDAGRYSAGTTVGDRTAGATLTIEERGIVGEVWEAGVCLGKYLTESLEEVVRIFDLWLIAGVSVSRLRDDTVVHLRPGALAHEQGPAAYVEHRWNELAADPFYPHVRELAAEAMRVPALRALLPFTSHHVLRFSRSTGYPFSHDCPSITPLDNGSFSVAGSCGVVIGTGNAREAAALAAAHLPPGCGPARRGPWPEPLGTESGDR